MPRTQRESYADKTAVYCVVTSRFSGVSRVVKFPTIIIVYLNINFATALKYSVLKLLNTECTGSVECNENKSKVGAS